MRHQPENKLEQQCFHKIFETVANNHPEKIAIYWTNQYDKFNMISYEALNQKANQLAHFLANYPPIQQTQPPIIAVCMERGPNYILSLLAIWKAGFIYQPLNASEESTVLLSKMEQSGCIHLLMDNHVAQKILARTEFSRTNLDDPDTKKIIAEQNTNNLRKDRKINEDAYLFTSSGTGINKSQKPKLIMNKFEGLPGRINGFLQHITFEANSVVLGFSLYTFDASLMDICIAFSTASALLIVPEYAQKDIGELHRLLQAAKNNNINITYAALIPEVISLIDFKNFSFKYLITMGAKSNWDNIEKLIKLGIKIYDGYGPTETTIAATLRELTLHTPRGIVYVNPKTKEIDGVLPGVKFNLVKKSADTYELVENFKDGEGEIILGGEGVGYYWQNDELNKKKFINFPGLGDGRFYLTGDTAQYYDGALEITGRTDREIKIHGKKINLDSCETRLKNDSNIQEAAITLFKEQFILSFVPLQPNTKQLHNILDVHHRLFSGLPAYLFTVKDIPKTANKGTPNYNELIRSNNKELERQLVSTDQTEPYQSELEKQIANLCTEIFIDQNIIELSNNNFQINRHELLQSLGANSLNLFFLHERLWEELVTRKKGKTYPSLDFKQHMLQAKTIVELAAVIEHYNYEPLQLIKEGEYPHLYVINTELKETDTLDCGIYLLNPFSLEKGEKNKIADEIVTAIIQHQIVEPYHVVLFPEYQMLEETIKKKFEEIRPHEKILLTNVNEQSASTILPKAINHAKNLQLEACLKRLKKKELDHTPHHYASSPTCCLRINQSQKVNANAHLQSFIAHETKEKILFLMGEIGSAKNTLVKNATTEEDCMLYVNVSNQQSDRYILNYLETIGINEKNLSLLKKKKVTFIIDNYDMMDRYDHPNLWQSNQLDIWEDVRLLILCNYSINHEQLNQNWAPGTYSIAQIIHIKPPSNCLISKLNTREKFIILLKKWQLQESHYAFDEFIQFAQIFYKYFPDQLNLNFLGSYWEEFYDEEIIKHYQACLHSKYFRILKYFLIIDEYHQGKLPSWFIETFTNKTCEKQELMKMPMDDYPLFLNAFTLKTISKNHSLRPIFLFCPLSNDIPEAYENLAATLEETHTLVVVKPLLNNPMWDKSKQLSLPTCGKIIAKELSTRYPNEEFTLLGWSFGGIQAFCVADALELLGKYVKQLITIDTPAITTITQIPLIERSVPLIRTMCTQLYSAPGTETIPDLLDTWEKTENDAKTLFQKTCEQLNKYKTTTDSRTSALILKLNACFLNISAEYELANQLTGIIVRKLKAPHYSFIASDTSPYIGNNIENIKAWATLCETHEYKEFRGEESRPVELPHQPLAERSVNLAIHSAPIKQTHLSFLTANAQINGVFS